MGYAKVIDIYVSAFLSSRFFHVSFWLHKEFLAWLKNLPIHTTTHSHPHCHPCTICPPHPPCMYWPGTCFSKSPRISGKFQMKTLFIKLATGSYNTKKYIYDSIDSPPEGSCPALFTDAYGWELALIMGHLWEDKLLVLLLLLLLSHPSILGLTLCFCTGSYAAAAAAAAGRRFLFTR